LPELPEAETIARTLTPHAAGRRVVNVEILARRATRGQRLPVEGRTIRAVRRHGKAVVLELDRGSLVARLGMTGRLLWNGQRGTYTRAILALDRGEILFDDVRQFGSLRWYGRPPAALAPDPLEVDEAEFRAMLKRRKGRIKPLVLNQKFLAGIGNIYADEILHRAGIHPRAVASRLGESRGRRLHAAMVEVLHEAIEAGGSSISDFVNADGKPGSFQKRHRVYGKSGEPCPACGAPIRRIVVAQRGTHYCPRCQKS
jgi:formamidopyrimidine-DNA glycosylase